MKHFTLLLLFLFIGHVSFSQAPEIEWQKCLGGADSDIAYSVQQTSDGGYILAGFTPSNDGDVSGNHGGADFWVVKLGQQGQIQWQRSLGGSSADVAYSVQQTSDGGYIVAGFTYSNDGDVSGNQYSGNQYPETWWVVKLDHQGQIQWQRSLGGSHGGTPFSVQQTSDGGYIVAGVTGSNDGDVSGNHGTNDFWVVKLDQQGQIQWQRSLGGSEGDFAYSVQQTSDSGYIIAGFTCSRDGNVSGNSNTCDMWVVKLDQQGQIQWQKTLGGTSWDQANSVQQTSDGGYIVAGFTVSNDGDVSGNHSYQGYEDFWVVKLDQQGQIQWQKTLGGASHDRANSVQQTTDGGYIVAGYTFSNDGDVSGNHGAMDSWMVKLDQQGQIQWQKTLGGVGYDQAASVQQTTDGGYIVAGATDSNDGDASGNHGETDFWIVKLAPDKPAPTTNHYHQLSQFPTFNTRKLLSSSPPYKVAADGSQASIFKFSGRDFTRLGVRIKENTTQNKDLYGEFTVISQEADSLVVRYTHPDHTTGHFERRGVKIIP